MPITVLRTTESLAFLHVDLSTGACSEFGMLRKLEATKKCQAF